MVGTTQGPRNMAGDEDDRVSAVCWEKKIEPTALVTVLLYLAVSDHPVIFVDQVKFYIKHSIFHSKGNI